VAAAPPSGRFFGFAYPEFMGAEFIDRWPTA
jgi:hypothetical protein